MIQVDSCYGTHAMSAFPWLCYYNEELSALQSGASCYGTHAMSAFHWLCYYNEELSALQSGASQTSALGNDSVTQRNALRCNMQSTAICNPVQYAINCNMQSTAICNQLQYAIQCNYTTVKSSDS